MWSVDLLSTSDLRNWDFRGNIRAAPGVSKDLSATARNMNGRKQKIISQCGLEGGVDKRSYWPAGSRDPLLHPPCSGRTEFRRLQLLYVVCWRSDLRSSCLQNKRFPD